MEEFDDEDFSMRSAALVIFAVVIASCFFVVSFFIGVAYAISLLF